MKIVIAGGTGFIGKALATVFSQRGDTVLILTRRPEKYPVVSGITAFSWLLDTSPPLENLLEGCDILINLAGEPLMKSRWSRARKEKIISSRTQATHLLIQALHKVHKRPDVFINASAIGWYGHRPFGEITEASPKGSGFLSQVCEVWEQESRKATTLGIRTVQARFGVILDQHGGFLNSLLPSFQWYLGGYPGDGSQWFSWIHLEDAVSALLFISETGSLEGPLNITAPHPIQMKAFCKQVGKRIKRPALIPCPAWILKWILQDMSEALLAGAKVFPEKLELAGYVFKYPTVQEALKATLPDAKHPSA